MRVIEGTQVIRIEAAGPSTGPGSPAAMKRRLGRCLAIVIPILLVIAWQVSAHFHWLDTRLFSSPSSVADAAWQMINHGSFEKDLLATSRRILVGYLIGSAIGILLGTLLGWSLLARSALRPLVAAAQTVPMLGILPLFLLIFGLGELPIYLVTVWGMTVLVSLGTMDAVASVPTSYLEAAKSLGVPRRYLFVEVVLPSAIPRIFTSLRIGIGLAVLSVIGIEFVVADNGIGQLIWRSWNLFQPAEMFVGVITASLIGVILSALLGLVQRIVVPWQREGSRIV